MPYNSQITRSDAQALIPEDVAKDIMQHIPESSIIMSQMPTTRLPDVPRNQQRIPVLSSLPVAYFLNPGQSASDTRLKQTSEAAWDNVFLNVEELAVIVPIPEAVLDDAGYDIWGQVKPHIAEAFSIAFDAAVIDGTNAPSAWPESIVEQAIAAGHSVDLSNFTDLYDAILGVNGALAKIEEDGYMATGHVAALSMRARLRGVRDADGRPIFQADPSGKSKYTLDGEAVTFPKNGVINPSTSLLISGEWRQLVWAMRQDITYKVLTEASIHDNSGNLVYNLAQQDMVALRCVMRLGYATPWTKVKNRVQPTDADRCPFSVLVP